MRAADGTWRFGRFGRSVIGTGQLTNASTADLAFTSGPWTVAGFFYLTALLSPGQFPKTFSRFSYTSESINTGWALQVNGSSNAYEFISFNNNATGFYVLGGGTQAVGTHLMVGTSDGTTRRLYVDGTQRATSANNPNPAATANNPDIGYWLSGPETPTYWTAAWRRCLNASEVLDLWQDRLSAGGLLVLPLVFDMKPAPPTVAVILSPNGISSGETFGAPVVSVATVGAVVPVATPIIHFTATDPTTVIAGGDVTLPVAAATIHLRASNVTVSIPIPPPTTDSVVDADLIAFRWDAGDAHIVNRLIADFDYDHASGEYTKTLIFGQNESIARYGPRAAARLQSQGLRTARGAEAWLEKRARALFKRFAFPPAVLQCQFFYRKHAWEAGDMIEFVSALVPNLQIGGRGIASERFEIVDARPTFADKGRLVVTLLDAEATTQPAGWPPVSILPGPTHVRRAAHPDGWHPERG